MRTEGEKKHILIISGGSIDADFARRYLAEKTFDMIISADSGMEFCRKAGILPDLILGDFDSASSGTLSFFEKECPDRIEAFPAKKDWTDTELALMRALDEGADQITILGATGTRLDHVMGNIHLLKKALDAGVQAILVDANNRIRMTDSSVQLLKKEQFGKYVSLIPFSPQVTGVTLKGFAYGLDNFTLQWGKTLGVSNEIQDEEALISLTEGILLVMESHD